MDFHFIFQSFHLIPLLDSSVCYMTVTSWQDPFLRIAESHYLVQEWGKKFRFSRSKGFQFWQISFFYCCFKCAVDKKSGSDIIKLMNRGSLNLGDSEWLASVVIFLIVGQILFHVFLLICWIAPYHWLG